jgi:glucose/arabinose dehydrogenase
MQEEPSEEATQQTPKRGPRMQSLLLGLLIVLVIAAGLLFSLRGEIFSSHPGSATPTSTPGVAGDPRVAGLHLPPGFHISVFYTGLNTPRFMTFSPDGTLFVAERGTGSIVALLDARHTGKATKQVVVTDLDDPTSLAFYQGALYVGEQARVSRFTLGPDFQVTSRQVIVPKLPSGGLHSTRTVFVGPDGRLYVSIGSDCNVCIETDPSYAAVWVYNLDGSGGHLYASGLRNAVGLATNPWNNQIWVTNNGSDYEGVTVPSDTIYALQAGINYGWPRCDAGDIIDPTNGHAGDCNGVIAPLIKMPAHSAPLGLAFYNAGPFPAQYHGLFVALHGSFYRTVPNGYTVVFIPLNAQGQIDGPEQDFVTGWLLKNFTCISRPVGVTVGPDGSLYISDDKGGMIYRVTYQQNS